MRLERLLLTGLLAIVFSATATPTSAQLLNNFLALEELTRATAIAKDSIGENAILVGIATAGMIELGSFGTYEGFDVKTGESSAWAYQFLTPSGDNGVAVGIAKFIIGDPLVFSELGNDFDLEPDELDLSGSFTNSDEFVGQLVKNATFLAYAKDYPDAIPEGIVLSWQPDAIEQLPDGFPLDKPIWGIFYNTNADVPDDSTMICFVSSGQGETHCVRFDVSSVDDPSGSNGGVHLSVAPNPVHKTGIATLRIESPESSGIPDEVSLYNTLGQQVIDLKNRLVRDAQGGFTAEFNLAGLGSGNYVCRVVRGNHIQSIQVIID